MKKYILTLAVVLGSWLNSYAATIVFTGAGIPGVTTLSSGSLTGYTVPDPGTDITTSGLTYTITGLTIDDDGTDNDSITLNWQFSGTDGSGDGSSIFAVGGAHFRVGTTGGGGGQLQPGDTFTFGAITLTGSSLSGGQSAQLDNFHYDLISMGNSVNVSESVNAAGNITPAIVGALDQDDFALGGSDTSATFTGVLGANRVARADFTVNVSAVPEPTTATLFAAALFGFVMLRRDRRA